VKSPRSVPLRSSRRQQLRPFALLAVALGVLGGGALAALGTIPAKAKRLEPGFGPHVQRMAGEGKAASILGCQPDVTVCCDPCGVCVCEHGSTSCPDIMLMYDCGELP